MSDFCLTAPRSKPRTSATPSNQRPWFRPVDIQVGPDGAIYVADMYEQRIDHASHYQGGLIRRREGFIGLREGDEVYGEV
jgi:glucose/arabinose dehydrogenase